MVNLFKIVKIGVHENIQKKLEYYPTRTCGRNSENNLTSSKKEFRDKENQERLGRAVETLDSIAKNNDVQKSVRNMIKEVLLALKDEKSGSVSVRAANAISLLDSATQSPQMQSHIRTMLWQVVSTLESIRE
jgi:uncharacterized protein (UPF0147 family)